MSAGTLTLTNNSDSVSGAGTAFDTGLAAGDFIVVTVGGVPYTLPVKSIESATALTLVSVYTGPTQSGAAWSAVPRVALNMVTAALVAQSAEALRGLNYDKQNWQQVFSGAGTITVKLPDGSTYTGPAWGGIKTSLDSKANKTDLDSKAAKGANSDITSLSGLTTALSLAQGGTGAKDAPGARTNLGISDKQLNSVDGKSGGQLSTQSLYTAPQSQNSQNRVGIHSFSDSSVGAIVGRTSCAYYGDTGYFGVTRGDATQIGDARIGIDKADGSYVSWSFANSGNATALFGSWINSSDERIKTNKLRISAPLEKMRKIGGYTWDRLDGAPSGLGFLAQEVKEILPTAVFEGGDTVLSDGKVIEKTLAVDVTGAAAALHHEAILALMDKVEELHMKIDELKAQQ